MNKKWWLLIALIGLLLTPIFVPLGFHKLSNRSYIYVNVPADIREKVIEETRGKDAKQIAKYCSGITCDLLSFSFDQDPLFQKKVSKAHCVTYARVCAQLCNIAYDAHHVQAKARAVVGQVYFLGINTSELLMFMTPQKYHRYYKDHDVVEVEYDGKVIWLDPSIHDLLGIPKMLY